MSRTFPKRPHGICLCLTADTLDKDLAQVAEYRRHVDLLELRADFLNPGEAALAGALPGKVDLPVILTIRRTREGGRFSAPEQERVQLLSRLAGSGFSFFDLEEDLVSSSLDGLIEQGGAGIIRSFHDRDGVPADLGERIARLARSAREIPKAAVTPRGASDLLRLLEAFRALTNTPKVLLGMGDYGFLTRVLAPKLGSLYCYSSVPGQSAAPGHIDPTTLDQVYRYHGVTSDTEVYGVIGSPVMHSLSPLIHNTGLSWLRRNAVYLPFLVDELAPFFQVADFLDIRGLSVTIPHKERVIGLLARTDPASAATGACNTMYRSPDGLWEGANTDPTGFLAPLVATLGGSIPPGLRATVIGAGGASRAVVHALTRSGARVLILNRTPDRARHLATLFNAQPAALDQSGIALMARFADLIVNATSMGMAPHADEDPVPGYRFSGREVAYDLVYVPQTTRFLSRALAAGCPVIRGRQMLLAQAMDQFRIFTGSDYPDEAKREIETRLDSRYSS